MRRIGVAAGLVSALAYLALAGIPAFGEDTGTVDTTVTVEIPPPCVLVSTQAVDYGDLPFSTADVDSSGASDPFNVDNCGSLDSDILVRSTEFSGPSGSWSLSDTSPDCSVPELNTARHLIQWNSGQTTVPLTTQDQLVFADVAAQDSIPAMLLLLMPCEGSDGVGETFSATVTFTAVLSE